MADQLAFLLFGDQSSDTHGFLAAFFRQPSRGILANAFLEQIYHELRKEVEALPRLLRSKIPAFQSLQNLNERYHTQPLKHPGLDGALLAISQLAHYIDYAEKNYEDFLMPHDQMFFSGLCSGMFAAAAITSTPTLSTLVPVAVQVVLMAFRTGCHVAAMAERLCPAADDHSESWTYILPGMTGDNAHATLETFNKDKGLSSATRAYVSAVSVNSVAISGPPTTLETLFASGRLPSKPTSIPVYGPYHAAHLHSTADVATILRINNDSVKDVFHKTKPRSHIMSSKTGEWIKENDTLAVLERVVREILNDTLLFHKFLDTGVDVAQAHPSKTFLIMPFGPTQNAATLANLLKSKTSNTVVIRNPPQISKESISSSVGNHGSKGRGKLAIVGMAGRFPDSASHEKLWELLEKGLSVHRVVPADRFPVATHYDPTGKAVNTSHTPYGCWIEKPGHFDPRFFNMSPREALQTDPMQRMALTTAYEALEMSGYVPNRTASTKLDRIGTFYGQTSDDWREINAAQEVDTYYITGGVRAFGPGRINYHFGFSGPSLNIDTACSSSAAAMNVACSSLWARDCDTAIVGGLSCMTNSDIFAGLSRGQFLSKTGPCSTFDNDADGYCRGDGCASVIVKRLEDAEADQDRILAVILGTATNHSADAISITHPHGPTQSILSTAILDEAGVDPLDVDYVEMHGTGTQAGDGTEMVSVTNVFAPANRKRPADRPLYLGAIKANVGHGEAASGVTALCKVLMMLQKNTIPPHVGIKGEINKTFPKDLSERNVNIAFHNTPFKRRDGKLRRVFINNFSAAGGNTGLLLEDAPRLEAATEDPRSHHVITVTAKSKAAMIRNAERLVTWMEDHPDTPISNLAYSTTARKIQHYWRMNVAVPDLFEARQAITSRLQESFTPVGPQQPKVAFLFTGQGSHYASLGKEFYENHKVFRQTIDEYNDLSLIHGFPSFMPLIDGSEQDISKLSPLLVQIGLCCFEMALARLWMTWGIKPCAVMGHSLGEYAALNIAGVLSASDTIYLVGSRARLLTEKCTKYTHVMLAVQGSVDSVTETLGARAPDATIACINGPRETVLAGETAVITNLSLQLSGAGFRCTQLNVPFAFHSAQVDPILDDFEKLAGSVTFRTAQVPVISPLLGKVVESEAINAAYLRDHARESVNFLGGLAHAQQHGSIDEKTVWVEIGPHPVCANLVKAAFGAATIAVPTVRRNEVPYKTLSTSLCTLHSAGLNIDWNDFHRDFASSVRILDLPSYSFDEKNYWLQYSGDWSLSKNRAALAAPAAVSAPAKTKLSTTSVQKIISEEVKGDVAIVEIESNLSREDLRLAVTGHLVNGAPLCPSSLYGDMAMTVGDYAYKLIRPNAEKIGCNVGSMEVPKTLIFDESLEAHVLRLKVTANVKTGTAECVFSTGEGAKKIEHALCKIQYGNTDDWASEFERADYLIRGRIEALKAAEKTGKASKIGRGLAYKLFAALVDYDRRYRGMEEVILDSDTCEATAKIVFQTSEKDGNYRFSPHWIDSLCHISGFIINGTDAVDSRDQVFISHGWGSMRFIETPQAHKEYRSYIRMQQVKGSKVMAGDVYVFDGDRLIGVTGDIRFQAIPRKVLNMMLPPRGAAAAAPARRTTAAPAAKTAPTAKKESAAKKEKKVLTPSNISQVNKKLTSVITQVMDILAKEIGVSDDELADNIAFADLGVDSLMGLTVSGRIREDLDLDIDSSAFVDHSTIKAFKTYMEKFEKNRVPAASSSVGDSNESSSETEETPELMDTDSNVTTPDNESEDLDVKTAPVSKSGNAELQAAIRATISEEMGVEEEEIVAAPDLANLGMDSLMSLSILGNLREKTGLDIPSDLFVSNPSLKDVERALGIDDAPKKVAAPKLIAPTKPLSSKQVKFQEPKAAPSTKIPASMVTATITKPPRPSRVVDDYPNRKASSLLLQGRKSATNQLFMIPDGSGSATSYTEISDIGSNFAVWGLFSPFMKTPDEYKCGVYGIATKFIDEMKKRQPVGPYNLAGWSAGGVIAYEIVVQLTKAGERVQNLIIIDAPCPVTIEPLPQSLHAWFASIGLLGEGDDTKKKIPEWLLPHFAASVTALSNYTAEAIPDDMCPNVMAIWCEDGVCHLPSDPRPNPYPTGHALFLLDNRYEFGPNRWDEYLDVKKITTRHMPGNHFSMMHGDYAKQLGKFMREALQ